MHVKTLGYLTVWKHHFTKCMEVISSKEGNVVLSDILRKQYFSYQRLSRCLSKHVSHCTTSAPCLLCCNMTFGTLGQLIATRYYTHCFTTDCAPRKVNGFLHHGKDLRHSSLKEHLWCSFRWFEELDVVVSSFSGYKSNSLSVSLASLARFLAAITDVSFHFCHVRVVLKIMRMHTKIIGHNCGFQKKSVGHQKSGSEWGYVWHVHNTAST